MSRIALLPLATFLGLMVWGPGESPAKDRGADGHFSQRRSSHFVLYQDVAIDHYSGPTGSREFERGVLDALEDSFDRVVKLLGVRPVRPVEVVVYDAEVFDTRFRDLFGFRAAGFYHGIIRVRGATRLSNDLLRTLQHEYVHAALDGASTATLPAWLNEGLAEWVEGVAVGKRHLSHSELALLVEALRRGKLPTLASLQGKSFAGLTPEQASLAYLKSYAVIEHLVRRYGEPLLRRFIVHFVRTGQVERSLDRAYRLTVERLEGELHAEVQ